MSGGTLYYSFYSEYYTTAVIVCLIEEGHRDVYAGQGTLLGIVLRVVYLMESSKRVQEQSETGGDVRVPDCPLNHVLHVYKIYLTFPLLARHMLSYSYSSTYLPVSSHIYRLRRRFR